MDTALRGPGSDEATRARGRRTAAPDVRDASRRFDEALATARLERRALASGPVLRTPVEHRRTERPPRAATWTRPMQDAPASAPVPDARFAPAAGELASPAGAALRAAVRALPPVIEAARLQDGARLALTLGGALGVDLRAGAAGVEVTLRPAPALAQAAAAELPALVAALRARGVRVADAGVAPGARPAPDRRAR